RGWFLSHEDVGATGIISLTRLDAGGTWSEPVELHSNNLSSTAWSPRVAINAAGDGLATFREDANSGGDLFAITLSADGTSGPKTRVGPDEQSFSIEPSIDDAGVRIGLYNDDDNGTTQIFSTDGTATGSEVAFSDPLGTGVISWNREPDGPGMLFAVVTGGDFQVVGVPWDPVGGFGAPEPIVANPSGLIGGAWLGDGRAVFVYGVFPGAGQRVQVWLTERLPEGTWAAPVRIDTGDGSAHASARPPLAAAPGEAIVRWDQPDGEKIARFVGGSGLTDTQTFARGSLYDVAADRCGNAVVLQRGAGNNALTAVHYQAAAGWQAPVDLQPDTTSAPQWADVTLTADGEGLVVYEYRSHYRFSTFR
ncbi:MAG: hypothetical protein AAF211_23565, partial [Myxococcota bacterium]